MKTQLNFICYFVTLLLCVSVTVRQYAMYYCTSVQNVASSETLGGILSPDNTLILRFTTYSIPEKQTISCLTRGYVSRVDFNNNLTFEIHPSTSRTIFWNKYSIPNIADDSEVICRSSDFQSYWLDSDTVSIDDRIISIWSIGYDYRFDVGRIVAR